MNPIQVSNTTLRISLWFAHVMLTFYAEGAKVYWKAWGPIGQVAIQAVQVWEGAQRQYLEALEGALAQVSDSPTSQKDRTSSPIDFLSVFGLLGFEDG